MTSPTPNWLNVWDTVNKLKTEVDELRLTVATMNPDFNSVDISDDLTKVAQIKRAVCDAFHLSENCMTKKQRPAHIAWPRQIAMALTRESTGLSLSAIGKCFGGRDHGTVLHAIERVKEREAVERQSLEVIKRIRAIISPLH